MLLTCAGFCFLTTLLLSPQKTETAEAAIRVAAQITDLNVPSGFQGKLGVTMDNVAVKFELAKFIQQQGRGNLTIAQLQSVGQAFAGKQNPLRQMVENLSPELKTLKVDQSRAETMTIRNLPAVFKIEVGEDVASTTRWLEISGVFRGKRDDALLILQCEDGILTDQDIEQFLKSIK